MINLEQRAKEIADFLKVPYEDAKWRLEQGFHYNHAKVADDFKANRPASEAQLLEWYRTTHAYIWELSAYHLEPGFNYMGMCEGAAAHLKAENKPSVLVLGDGVGDLSATLSSEGLCPTYHDLSGSKTAAFTMYHLDVPYILTSGWIPMEFNMNNEQNLSLCFDAVIAWDFFEHLTEVEIWTQTVYRILKPGGIFQAQNAFAIGDAEHGDSIPMHLSRNNRFEHDWLPLLESIGFTNLGNGWHQK
jgi:SAM-dependent methyltransferase